MPSCRLAHSLSGRRRRGNSKTKHIAARVTAPPASLPVKTRPEALSHPSFQFLGERCGHIHNDRVWDAVPVAEAIVSGLIVGTAEGASLEGSRLRRFDW